MLVSLSEASSAHQALCYSWTRSLKIISDRGLYLGWPGSSFYTSSSKYSDLWCVDLLHDYIYTHSSALETDIVTPIYTDTELVFPSLPHLCRNIFKKPLSHYWITSNRKRQIWVPVDVCVLLFHLGTVNCRQLNQKQSTAATNQVWRKRYFFLT